MVDMDMFAVMTGVWLWPGGKPIGPITWWQQTCIHNQQILSLPEFRESVKQVEDDEIMYF